MQTLTLQEPAKLSTLLAPLHTINKTIEGERYAELNFCLLNTNDNRNFEVAVFSRHPTFVTHYRHTYQQTEAGDNWPFTNFDFGGDKVVAFSLNDREAKNLLSAIGNTPQATFGIDGYVLQTVTSEGCSLRLVIGSHSFDPHEVTPGGTKMSAKLLAGYLRPAAKVAKMALTAGKTCGSAVHLHLTPTTCCIDGQSGRVSVLGLLKSDTLYQDYQLPETTSLAISVEAALAIANLCDKDENVALAVRGDDLIVTCGDYTIEARLQPLATTGCIDAFMAEMPYRNTYDRRLLKRNVDKARKMGIKELRATISGRILHLYDFESRFAVQLESSAIPLGEHPDVDFLISTEGLALILSHFQANDVHLDFYDQPEIVRTDPFRLTDGSAMIALMGM